MLPLTLTATTDVFEEIAVYVRSSPSGSVNFGDTSTSSSLPTYTDCDPMLPFASGARFTCRTVTVTSSVSLSESSPTSSVTVSSNVRFVFSVTSGAMNVGDATVVLLSVAVGPAVCVHA